MENIRAKAIFRKWDLILFNINSDNVACLQWKLVFAERYRLRRNWLKGLCTVRTFEGHTQGISCVQFDDTRIVSGSSDKSIKVSKKRQTGSLF